MQLTYILMPDVAGKFVTKTASLAEFARDAQGVFVRKVIPPLAILNCALLAGGTGREADWDAFSISPEDYAELVSELAGEPPLGYRVDVSPPEVVTHDQWVDWVRGRY